MKTFRLLVDSGLMGWIVWYIGMFVLIAGIFAMAARNAIYLEFPLSMLMIPLLIYYLQKREKSSFSDGYN